jgi:LIM domain kinase 1
MNPQPPSLSSILTIKASPVIPEPSDPVLPASASVVSNETVRQPNGNPVDPLEGSTSIFSIASADTYHTARSDSVISSAMATGGGSSLLGNYTGAMVHRFTLMKPGAKPKSTGTAAISDGWRHLDLLFSSAILVAKCDICAKRLGWKPVLECDDCGMR